MPIILTIVIIAQGYFTYQLNKKVTERDVEINKGKQVLLLYNTREFLIRYITNFLKYLAYEHNKILTTHFNIIYSGKPADPALPLRERPTISRRYYVNTLLLKTFHECRPLIGFPDEQNQIDAYFGANPALSDLEKGIFNSKQTVYYLDLKRLIDQFNQDFNKFATINKQLEEQEIKILLKDKKRSMIDWTKLLIYKKNSLVQSIKIIKEKGDLLLKSFPELNVETLKFNIEINAPEPLRKYEGVNTKEEFEGYINPIKEATIFLDVPR
jgi:hypothetical protein